MRTVGGIVLLVLGFVVAVPAVQLFWIARQADADPFHIEREISGVAVLGRRCDFYTAVAIFLVPAATLILAGVCLMVGKRSPA